MSDYRNGTHLKRNPVIFTKATINLVLNRLGMREMRFRGAFTTYTEALAAVRPGLLAGYDHEAITDICFDGMCRIASWDWPVLYWLHRLAPEIKYLLDAGGHQGTKFRAFRNHLDLSTGLRWVIYDVPSMVRAGRERAARDGFHQLFFIDSLDEAPKADVLLASGLLQYLDISFEELIRQLPAPPRHMIINKVATRKGPTFFTLEDFGNAEVPYQIRNYDEFISSIDRLGYDVIDEWQIPELSRQILTHPHLGLSTSRGFYARLRAGV